MDFSLRYDRKVRVLIITFGKIVTDDEFLAGFAAVRDFVNHHGPYHGIADFSQVEDLKITNELLDALGSISPAFPAPMRRVVVASAPAAYVCARIVQTLRADSSAPIEIAATTDVAYARLGTDATNFVDE